MSGAPAARLDRLLEAIASKEPAPASGSAAAAVLAAAAALLEKCAAVSTAHMADAAAALATGHALRLHAEELIERDMHAYLEFVQVQRAARGLAGEALGDALRASAAKTVDVPLDIVRSSAQVLEMAELLSEKGNPKLKADAVVGAILCAAAAEAAALLIAVNLGASPGAGTGDARLSEAKRLERSIRTRARRLASPVPGGGRGRARARSADSGRP